MSLHDRIKEARRNKGMTQTELGQCIGVAKTTIAGYEKDEHQPGLFNLVVLADTLGVGLDEYIGRQAKGRDNNEGATAEDPALAD